MRDVNGPNDVKPGDLVRYIEWGEYRSTESVVTVVRAGDKRLTFRKEDGATSVAAYTRTVTGKVFRATKRWTHRNFIKLEERDLWLHRMPVARYVAPVMSAEGVRSAVVLAPALANTADLAVVHDEIDRLAAWMATEPRAARTPSARVDRPTPGEGGA